LPESVTTKLLLTHTFSKITDHCYCYSTFDNDASPNSANDFVEWGAILKMWSGIINTQITLYFYDHWILASLLLVLQVLCNLFNVYAIWAMLRATYEVKCMIGFHWKLNASIPRIVMILLLLFDCCVFSWKFFAWTALSDTMYTFLGGAKFLFWMRYPDTRHLMLVRLKI
jgi:hypothetical protein